MNSFEGKTLTGVVIGPDDDRKYQIRKFPAHTDELVRAVINELADAFDTVRSNRWVDVGEHSMAIGFVADNGRANRLTQNVLATQVLRPNGNWTLLGPCVILGENRGGYNTDLDEFWLKRVRDEAQQLGWMGIPSS